MSNLRSFYYHREKILVYLQSRGDGATLPEIILGAGVLAEQASGVLIPLMKRGRVVFVPEEQRYYLSDDRHTVRTEIRLPISIQKRIDADRGEARSKADWWITAALRYLHDRNKGATFAG